jgi:hypothetical protein
MEVSNTDKITILVYFVISIFIDNYSDNMIYLISTSIVVMIDLIIK